MSDIQFVEIDSKTIENQLIKDFEDTLGETLYPGDERRIFLMQETPVVVGLKNDINESAKQNLLRYAKGDVLDALGERVNTPRLEAQKAITTLKWTLSSAQPTPVTIAKGKRATPDGTLYFENTEDLVIPSGQTYGTVKAQATEAGEKYNGFAPGQINKIVDTIPFLASVENIDESSGGADVEPDDDGVNVWSGYRERIRRAPGSFSTAGPEDAYIYHAMSADANIQDISVTTDTIKVFNLEAFQQAYPAVDPSPFYTERPGAEIKITALMKDGELPTQNILDAIIAKCSNKKVRPLSDHVTASGPETVTYNIELTYYISKDRANEETSIRSAIEDVDGVIDQYKLWQKSKLGRAINPDELRDRMRAKGAYRIEMISPIFTEINKNQCAVADTVTITYGGLI